VFGETRNTYRTLMWKSLGKCHFEDRRRWEDNVKINLTDINGL
jgi:hypothetical protein